jgi:hypothetical protein
MERAPQSLRSSGETSQRRSPQTCDETSRSRVGTSSRVILERRNSICNRGFAADFVEKPANAQIFIFQFAIFIFQFPTFADP